MSELGNHAEALQNYLEGLKYVKNRNEGDEFSYILYDSYFQEIGKTVEIALKKPVSMGELGRDERATAGRHFSQGYSLFWDGEYEKALPYFDNAIAVVWQHPAYWYYRGLTHWKLSNEKHEEQALHKKRAAFNFLFGSQIERNSVQRDMVQAVTSTYLTRFQGRERMFLEQIRWGDPTGLIQNEFMK